MRVHCRRLRIDSRQEAANCDQQSRRRSGCLVHCGLACDYSVSLTKLETASTHKSAKTHAGNVFVIRDLDLWPIDPKINMFTRLIVQHFCVRFGGPSCISF